MRTERWRRAKEVFNSAVELPPRERDSFLRRECEGDAGLRTDVEALLKAHDAPDSFIERPAVQRAGLATPPIDWIGRRFGPYRIVGEVERGGMSEVYRAVRDDNQYQKDVAIKFLRHGFDSESLLRRFRAEPFVDGRDRSLGLFRRRRRALTFLRDRPFGSSALLCQKLRRRRDGLVHLRAELVHRRVVLLANASELLGMRQRELSAPPFGVGFELLWPPAERSLVQELEAALNAGDPALALRACEALIARSLAGAAAALGTNEAPRDPATMALVLGIDGRRYLAFRSLARETRQGRAVSITEALTAYALAIQIRIARSAT